MRASISEDRNNVDEIGSANDPGLRTRELTRAQHRARLVGAYRGRLEELEKLLDTIYGAECRLEKGGT